MKAMCVFKSSRGVARPFAAAIGALVVLQSAHAVIQTVELGYLIRYQQTGPTSPPVLQNYSFFSRLTTDDEFDALQSFVRPTSSASFPQRELIDLDGGLTYEFASNAYATEAAVRADFPAGNYQFNITGGSLGNRSANFAGPSTLLWPTLVPRFFSATYNLITVGVSPYSDLTLTFNSPTLPAGATIATTTVQISDTTGYVVFSATLPNTAGSLVVPANTLDADTEYTAELRFEALVNFPGAGFPGGTGAHRFQRSTTAPLLTNPPCLADFNGVDGINLADLFDYLNAWFSGSASANIDGIPGVTTSDLFAFLNAWFQRC